MFQEKITDYFVGVAAKYLSAVDARPERSNQHEIGGLPSAGFKQFLGTPRKEEKSLFRARMVFLSDDSEVPLVVEDDVTWYDVRWNQPHRGPEYRLYYKTNEVTEKISEGDFLLVGKLHDGSLLLFFAPAGSTAELQIRAIFGIQAVTGQFQKVEMTVSDLLLPLRMVLEDIGLVFMPHQAEEDAWLERIVHCFGENTFPSTVDFSAFARKSVDEGVDAAANPDGCVIRWMDHEERLFRILERQIVKKQLLRGFGEAGDDVDFFIRFSLSVQNRRKSRVGRAFENHLAEVFKACSLFFEQGGGKNTTEHNGKPDFLFPSFAAYREQSFSEKSLRLLGAKTTCKDRWRQVLSEGNRVKEKHLVTLEAAISESQTNEMKASGLQLVVPLPLQQTYTPQQQSWLLSLADFIEEVKSLQRA